MSAKSNYLEKAILDHVLGTSAMSSPSANGTSLYTTTLRKTILALNCREMVTRVRLHLLMLLRAEQARLLAQLLQKTSLHRAATGEQ